MNQFRPTSFKILPPVVKNLLIINGLFFLATMASGMRFGINLDDFLAMHYPASSLFKPHQLVTYMFMHGGFQHILFNMFALWMFGNALENIWGPKRFLVYYMITGIGAGLLHLFVMYLEVSNIEAHLNPETVAMIRLEGLQIIQEGKNFIDPEAAKLNLLYNTPTVGASGAVFGILLAFGMTFPNSMIYVFFAIPIKAKYFVMIYGAIELFSGFYETQSNVAHFAHLGGMLFGFIVIKYWKRK